MTPALFAVALGLGAGFGLGVVLLVGELLPATPSLGPALARLQPPITGAGRERASTLTTVTSRLSRIIPADELRVLGRTSEQFVTSLIVTALLGLALPGMLLLLLAAMGRSLPAAVPIAALLGFPVLLVWILHRDVRQKAATARAEARRAICSYLDLVALQRAAGRGSVECLERAAEIGHGWVFQRIQETLLRSRWQMSEPWAALKQLAADMGVPALGDLGDIMQAAGVTGAQVFRSLRARAAGLRKQILADELAQAETRTSKLEIPAALLLIVIMLAAIYPFVAQLTAGPSVP